MNERCDNREVQGSKKRYDSRRAERNERHGKKGRVDEKVDTYHLEQSDALRTVGAVGGRVLTALLVFPGRGALITVTRACTHASVLIYVYTAVLISPQPYALDT